MASHGRNRLLSVLLLVYILPVTGSAADGPKRLAGTIAVVDQGSIGVIPLTRGAAVQTFAVRPDTKIVRAEIGIGGIHDLPATVAEMRAGALVSMTSREGVAIEVRLLPPSPTTGKIAAVNEASLTIHTMLSPTMGLAIDDIYRIDAAKTQVSLVKADGAAAREVPLSALKAGQTVMVQARDGIAYTIRIAPAPAFPGVLDQVLPGAAVVMMPAHQGEKGPIRRRVVVNGDTEFFHQYFGERLESTTASAFVRGQRVSVNVEADAATAITIIHPAIYGHAVRIGPSSITVELEGTRKRPAPTQEFLLNEGSKIFIGKQEHPTTVPTVRSAHIWRFTPGGKLADLKPGWHVSISAKENLVLSMRATPSPTAATRPVASR